MFLKKILLVKKTVSNISQITKNDFKFRSINPKKGKKKGYIRDNYNKICFGTVHTILHGGCLRQ